MSNTARIIEDLVSLEAWHSPLKIDCESPFHVALAFSDARYSGDADTPIEFQVTLKRATLVVVCDEKLTIPKASKVRHFPDREQTIRQLQGQQMAHVASKENATDDAVELGFPKTGLKVSDKTAKMDAAEDRQEALTEMTETLKQSVELTYRTSGLEHHWDCQPIAGNALKGRAHDGTKPLMRLKPSIKDRLHDLGVRVFIKCKADDFQIDDITIKPNFRERLTGTVDLDRRMKLAREVIKVKLAEAQLEVVELEPRFQEVILADVVSLPE